MAFLPDETLEKYAGAKKEKFNSKINGTTFQDELNPGCLECVGSGDFVALQAELDNNYDPTAVGVWHNKTSTKLGYIPKATAADIWGNMVNRGDLYVGKVIKTGGTKGKEIIGFNLEVIRLYFDE